MNKGSKKDDCFNLDTGIDTHVWKGKPGSGLKWVYEVMSGELLLSLASGGS